MYSLRRTLAVRFSLTIFVALLFIALWAYLGARRILHAALDRNLAAAAQLELAVVASRLPIALLETPAELTEFTEKVNRFVVVRDSQGLVVEANTPLAMELPVDGVGFLRARTGEPVWVTQRWGTERMRSYYAPAPPGSRPHHVVLQVAASMRPFETASRQVLLLMLGTVVLGTVATALGASWLANSSVTPVAAIAREAGRIQPRIAGQRITEHADVEEFADLVRVINSMLDRLERAFESQRRMIADTGHDLRTPLTAMRGELEVALRGERDPEQYRAVLRSVLEGVEHLTAISDKLVFLARLEAGELAPDREEIDVHELVSRAVQAAESRADGRTVSVAPPQGETRAAVDGKMVRAVVNQLLENALHHTPTGTRITAGVQGDRDQVTVWVDDSGPGMAPEELPRLFEHFYRTDAARSEWASGLGLTIAAAIVQAHGGTIRAESSRLGGLRVSFSLPRHSLGSSP